MNKHFVIMPNGVKATRNSRKRTYTHCVMVEWNKEALLERVKEQCTTNEWRDVFLSNWRYLHKEANGTSYMPSPERMEQAKAMIAETPTFEEYVVRCQNDRIERYKKNIAEGHYDPAVVTWCGRYDLAVKAQATEAKKFGATATILPVHRI